MSNHRATIHLESSIPIILTKNLSLQRNKRRVQFHPPAIQISDNHHKSSFIYQASCSVEMSEVLEGHMDFAWSITFYMNTGIIIGNRFQFVNGPLSPNQRLFHPPCVSLLKVYFVNRTYSFTESAARPH